MFFIIYAFYLFQFKILIIHEFKKHKCHRFIDGFEATENYLSHTISLHIPYNPLENPFYNVLKYKYLLRFAII
jgi:hypothetical protein